MTVDEARNLTAQATAVDGKKALIVLGLWHEGIRKAAGAGRSSVRESELDRVRTPIPASARKAAREQLTADGFSVKCVADGPNEDTFEVSW